MRKLLLLLGDDRHFAPQSFRFAQYFAGTPTFSSKVRASYECIALGGENTPNARTTDRPPLNGECVCLFALRFAFSLPQCCLRQSDHPTTVTNIVNTFAFLSSTYLYFFCLFVFEEEPYAPCGTQDPRQHFTVR